MVNAGNSSAANRLNIGFLWQTSQFQHTVFSAFEIGVKRIRHEVHDYNIHYSMEDTSCNPKIGMKAVLKLKKKYQQLDAIIGPRCSLACEPVGLYAAALNIPQVGTRCISDKLSDKKNYPTFTSARGFSKSVTVIIFSLLQKLGWSSFSIVTSDFPLFKLAAEQLRKLSEEHGMKVQLLTCSSTVRGGKVDQKKLNTLRQLLHGLRENSRVTLIYKYDEEARNVLILARYEGLLSEDHVFIGFDSAYRGTRIAVKYIEPELTDNVVYEGVIAVTEDDNPKTKEWKKFQNEIASSLSKKNFTQTKIETVLEKAESYTGERGIYFQLYELNPKQKS